MSVTDDVAVLKKMKFKKPITSAKLAAALGLTVFQITARLASMEKRRLVKRTKDRSNWLKLRKWHEVQREQAEESKKKAIRVAAWKAGIPPQAATDEGVPRIEDTHGWTGRYMPYADDRYVFVFTDPHTTNQYIRAHFSEKADIIRDFRDLPSVRLVKFDKKNRLFRAVEEYHRMLEAMLDEEVA